MSNQFQTSLVSILKVFTQTLLYSLFHMDISDITLVPRVIFSWLFVSKKASQIHVIA